MTLAEREQTQVGLLLMDFDGFKEVNDTLGHPSGDVLLKKIAQRLRSSLRGSDTIARLGGDEFAVLITSFSEEQGAVMVAEKIRSTLYAPFEIAGEDILISASIGIALYPHHGLDADTLTKLADVAMYAAKRSGGGYAVYGSEAPPRLPDDSRR